MKEQLYTIPVNEAFDQDCECPICEMYHSLEVNAIEFMMGPSYMEDDVRAVTNKMGFCEKHIKEIYQNQNRLGMALILKTHMDKTLERIEKLTKDGAQVSKPSMFKKVSGSKLSEYIDMLDKSCYICNRIEATFNRYIITVFYLYENDDSFRKKFKESKGFCTKHYGLLYEECGKNLGSKQSDEFIQVLNQLYLDNFKRVRDDLSWFIDKFDYRYTNEPWKNSKDALPRTMIKVNSTTP